MNEDGGMLIGVPWLHVPRRQEMGRSEGKEREGFVIHHDVDILHEEEPNRNAGDT